MCGCGCGNEIPNDRIEALIFLEIPESLWTLVEHSEVHPVKGVYMGESGTSPLIVCDEIGSEEGWPKDGRDDFNDAEPEEQLIVNVKE